jgi:hypothetical protein
MLSVRGDANMMNLKRITPRESRLREVERWIRSIVPRSTPRSSPVPRVLAGVAILLTGAAGALLLSPKNGREMRAITRKQIAGLRLRARSFATREGRRVGNGRAAQSPGERPRRPEATS